MSRPAPTNNIGGEIRRVREDLGLTLAEFAERTGIPWQTLAQYELGHTVPPGDRLLLIVNAAKKAGEPFQVEKVARAVAMAA